MRTSYTFFIRRDASEKWGKEKALIDPWTTWGVWSPTYHSSATENPLWLLSLVSLSPSVNSTSKDPKEYLASACGNLKLQMQKYCFWSLVFFFLICHWGKEPKDIRDQLYFWENIFKISYTWTHTVQIQFVRRINCKCY